jgi:ABC-type Mn2+/Zn2+ transport system permease subunit
MFIAWTAASLASLGGLLFSYYGDFSVGPAIALFLGAVLGITALISRFRKIQPINNVEV